MLQIICLSDTTLVVIYFLFTDIPECDYNLCEQNCTEEEGSYSCFCVDGFLLGNDSHRCDGVDKYYVHILILWISFQIVLLPI